MDFVTQSFTMATVMSNSSLMLVSLESQNALADALSVLATHVHVVASVGMESLINCSIRLSVILGAALTSLFEMVNVGHVHLRSIVDV